MQDIHWLGHARVRIDGPITIYIDPWKLGKDAIPADLILITHGHHDHLSVKDIAKIAKPDTIIICPAACASELSGDVRTIAAGDSIDLGQVRIEAVPSYNKHKPFHPKKAGNVGYVVQVDGRHIYHAGDTDLIPEMSEIRCDVALLPIGGTYTMNAREAARAAELLHAKVVIPIHWGDIVGSKRDALRLIELAPEDIQVVVLDQE